MTYAPAAPIDSRSTWAGALLAMIGAPLTQNNINTIVAWETAEGGAGPQFGVSGNVTNYNPINVAFPQASYSDPGAVYGATPTSGNGDVPVASFPSWESGLTATSARLQQPFASGILQALRSNASIQQTAAAVGASGWGTGDFANISPNNATASGNTVQGSSSSPGVAQGGSITGLPSDSMPPNPGIGDDPIAALGSQVQWLGEWLGWALFILIIFLFGAVLFLLGAAVLISIFAGPAVGPVAAAIGKKSPVGRAASVVGSAASTRSANRAAAAAGPQTPEDIDYTPQRNLAKEIRHQQTGTRNRRETRPGRGNSTPNVIPRQNTQKRRIAVVGENDF